MSHRVTIIAGDTPPGHRPHLDFVHRSCSTYSGPSVPPVSYNFLTLPGFLPVNQPTRDVVFHLEWMTSLFLYTGSLDAPSLHARQSGTLFIMQRSLKCLKKFPSHARPRVSSSFPGNLSRRALLRGRRRNSRIAFQLAYGTRAGVANRRR